VSVADGRTLADVLRIAIAAAVSEAARPTAATILSTPGDKALPIHEDLLERRGVEVQ
jgi:hypothetical protein